MPNMEEQMFDNILEKKEATASVEVSASVDKPVPEKRDNRNASQNRKTDNSKFPQKQDKHIAKTLENLLKEEQDMFEGILDGEIVEELKQSHGGAEDEKTYRMMYKGTDIDVDAASLWVSLKRSQDYIQQIMRLSTRSTNRRRAFWSDMIMLNLITTKMLKQKTPAQIEQLLNPIKYKKITKTYDITNEDGEQETIEFEV